MISRITESIDTMGNRTVYYWDPRFTAPERTISYDKDGKVLWDTQVVEAIIDAQQPSDPVVDRAISDNLFKPL